MQRGKPVIVFKAGGPQEVIEHGKNGLLANELTPESLAEQIHEFVTNETLRRELQINTHVEICKKVSNEQRYKVYIGMINKALKLRNKIIW